MFEEDDEEVDDVQTDNVAMETEDGEIPDLTDVTSVVTTETDAPLGLKRKADSPLDPHESSAIETNTEGAHSEDSNTSFKLKIKVGYTLWLLYTKISCCSNSNW